jgi:hypothetical protein
MKRRRTIFHARVDRYGYDKKCAVTRYPKPVFFLHQVGSAGHVVHSSASGKRNVDAPIFMLG